MESLPELTKHLELSLWASNPSYFFEKVFGQVPYPYQKKVLDSLSDLSLKRVLVLSAGGTGKTKLLAGEALWLAVPKALQLQKPIGVIIISGSDDQAKNLYNYCREAIRDSVLLQSLVEGEPQISLTKFKNGSYIIAVPNSQKSIQGKHCDVVLIDEAAIAGDFVIRDALRITSTSWLDRIILSGTPMQYDCLFVEMWESPNDYPEWNTRFSWSAMDCPNISNERLLEAKKLPADMYSIFWEGKPYSSSMTMIPLEDIKSASRDVKVEFVKDSRSVAGLDWGWAAETVLTIRQKIDGIFYITEVIGWRREEFEDLHKIIEETCKAYNVDIVYADSSSIGENQRLQARGLRLIPVKFTSEKASMQANLKAVFHQKRIKIPDDEVELLNQLRKYNWNTHDKDDRVDSLMLSLKEEDVEESLLSWKILVPRRRTDIEIKL